MFRSLSLMKRGFRTLFGGGNRWFALQTNVPFSIVVDVNITAIVGRGLAALAKGTRRLTLPSFAKGTNVPPMIWSAPIATHNPRRVFFTAFCSRVTLCLIEATQCRAQRRVGSLCRGDGQWVTYATLRR